MSTRAYRALAFVDRRLCPPDDQRPGLLRAEGSQLALLIRRQLGDHVSGNGLSAVPHDWFTVSQA
jgi:hypothetical protein